MALSRLGEVIFNVNTGETFSDTNNVTSFPVEDGNNIVDNIDTNPTNISFSGIIHKEGAEQKLEILRNYLKQGTILMYVGRNTAGNVVIKSMSTNHDNTIKGGFKFDISLQEIQIAELQTITVDFSKVPRPVIEKKKTRGKKQRTTSKARNGAGPVNFDQIQSKINSRLGGS